MGLVSLLGTGLTVLTWLLFSNVYVTVITAIALLFANLSASRMLARHL
jgi:hypothetical protein